VDWRSWNHSKTAIILPFPRGTASSRRFTSAGISGNVEYIRQRARNNATNFRMKDSL